MAPLGYDPLGLTNSDIQVSSSYGYVATHIYGLTEFDIDRDSKALSPSSGSMPPGTVALVRASSSEGRLESLSDKFTFS